VPKQSGNQSAFKHLIRDGRRYSVDEFSAHLGIGVKQLDYPLFPGARRSFLAFLFPQLFAGRSLVLLDEFPRRSV
jgi:hypothetical protein